MADAQFVTDRRSSVVATHKVLRNTYMLLSMTLLFSAGMAGVAMAVEAPPLGIIPVLIGMFGLLFLVHKLKNSVWGLAAVFAFTGFLGFILGPLLNYHTATAAGTQAVLMAAGTTGFIFLGLSGYTLVTQKDFSYLAGFIMTGAVVLLGAIILQWIGPMFGLVISGLDLAISAGVVILMSGLILFETSQIIHGGETNYILATVSLYLSIYNIFVHLLHLFTALDE